MYFDVVMSSNACFFEMSCIDPRLLNANQPLLRLTQRRFCMGEGMEVKCYGAKLGYLS